MANYTSVYTGQELDNAIKLTQQSIATLFDSSTTYAIGDYCTYQGLLYRCIVAGQGAWDASKWTAVTVINAIDNAISGAIAASY